MPKARDLIESEYRMMKLSDILDDEQIRVVVGILNGAGDSVKKAAALKSYLGGFRKKLEAKEVLPEYLAYWLVANEESFRAYAATLN